MDASQDKSSHIVLDEDGQIIGVEVPGVGVIDTIDAIYEAMANEVAVQQCR